MTNMFLFIFNIIAIFGAVNSDFCISSEKAYFISGTYSQTGVSAGGPVYTLRHPCGTRTIYYNSAVNMLLITADKPYTNSINIGAKCNDKQITDPLECTSWGVAEDLIVSQGQCQHLCGSNAACIPQFQITINDATVRAICRGVFNKLDYMDVYTDDNMYWYRYNDIWRCINQLPRCDGVSFGVYNQLTHDEMQNIMTCGFPGDTIGCNG
eukprot:962286_1